MQENDITKTLDQIQSQLSMTKQNSIDIAVDREKIAYIEEQLKTVRMNLHDVRNKNIVLSERIRELEHKQAIIIKAAWGLFTITQGILGTVTYFFK